MLCHVALCTPPYATLTYTTPEGFPDFDWKPGLRVAVPLGSGAIRVGVITAVFDDGDPRAVSGAAAGQHSARGSSGVTLRPLTWPLELAPLLPRDYMDTVEQLAARQYSSPGRILGNLLPQGLRVTARIRVRQYLPDLDGKGRKEWNQKWYNLWESNFTNRYTIFTPQYYAEDIDIYARDKKAEYSKGEPRFWVENGGEDVVRALKLLNTGAVVPTQVVLTHEFNHTKCMAKAAYRLAALLNDIFK